MTREEAIENLRRLQNLLFNAPYIDTSTIITTCNTAIEALEQTELNSSYNSVKTELNELDCISRQSVLEKGKDYWECKGESEK